MSEDQVKTQPVFVYETVIRESHLDSFGHVNNATYLELLEEARWELITCGGYGLNEVHEYKQGPVILEVNLKFRKELRLRERIQIEIRFLEVGRKTARMEQTILNSNGEVSALAVFVFAFFDLKERRIISPSPRWLRALGLSDKV